MLADRKRQGFSVLEAGAALLVTGLIGAAVMHSAFREQQGIKAELAADRMIRLAAGARSYVRDKVVTLAAATKPGDGAIVIPVARSDADTAPPEGPGHLPSPQEAGYLPSVDIDVDTFGEHHILLVHQPVRGQVEAMLVATGGHPVDDALLGLMAHRVGPDAGMVLVHPPAGLPPGTIQGAGGGWVQKTSDWQVGQTGSDGIQAGRAVVLLGTFDVVSPMPPASPQPTGTPRGTIPTERISSPTVPNHAAAGTVATRGVDAPAALVDELHRMQDMLKQIQAENASSGACKQGQQCGANRLPP